MPLVLSVWKVLFAFHTVRCLQYSRQAVPSRRVIAECSFNLRQQCGQHFYSVYHNGVPLVESNEGFVVPVIAT